MTQAGNELIEKVTNIVNDEDYYYVGVRASPFATDCVVFGLTSDEIVALNKRFPNSGSDMVNGVLIRGFHCLFSLFFCFSFLHTVF